VGKIRVLIVDDSAFLRRNLSRILASDPEIEVVGTAANGAEAVQMVKELRPNVVTLDVMMPVMDGLAALKQIMREAPTPVVMLSATTAEGAQETLEALALGAIDFMIKPSGPISLDIEKIRHTLVEKVKIANAGKIMPAISMDVTRAKFRAIIKNLSTEPAKPDTPPRQAVSQKRLVAIAASTGGPAALQLLLPQLPATVNAGIVIVQHIAVGFSRLLAERLNSLSQIAVILAEDGMPIRPGVAQFCPAKVHMTIEHDRGEMIVRLNPEPATTLHRPSADILFDSIARCCPAQTCGVILTGMGDDGARGLLALRQEGGYTIAQDEESSVIYGMPRRALEMGGISLSLPLDEIAAEMVRVTTNTSK